MSMRSACCILLTPSLHLRSSSSWDLDEPFDDDTHDDTVNGNDDLEGDDFGGNSFADNEHHNQNVVCICDGNKDSFINDLQDNDGLGPGNCVSVARAIDCFDDDSDDDCGDSCSHDFDCGCVDDDDDVDDDPSSAPTLDVGNDDSEYNDVTSATPTF